jgi:hypothetical protein
MATDILDIEINIGANTQDLGAELQKAENLLNKLQAKLKKSTDVGEIQKLNTKITSVESAIGTLNTRMNAVGRPAADATNALGNLSRVAQDAPYGFIGIANNLNPLLESFQRLSKESGSSSNALKAMVSGLTGPAGIGIALGVVSSLVVAFGDDIAEFINKATGGSQAIVEFGKSFTAAKDAFSSAYIQMENLNNSFDQFHNGTKSKKSVLDEYNQSLGKVYGTTKDIAEAEKIFIDNKDNYVKAALYRAAGQVALKKAAEEAFKQLEAQNAPSTANKTSMFMGEGLGTFMLSKFTGTPVITATDVLGSTAISKKAKEQETLFKGIFEQFNKLAEEQDKFAEHTKDFGKDLEKPSPIVNYAREENKQLNLELAKMKALREKMKSIGLEPLQLFELPSEERAKEDKRKGYFEKQAKGLLEESNKSGFGSYMQDIFKKDKTQLDVEAAEKKRIDDLTQSYAQFAQTLSGSVTNALFQMYDAIQEGQNPLEVIANMFKQIALNLAAMVVQALIFQAIIKAFPALEGAFTAIGLIGKATSGMQSAGAISSGINANSTFNAGAMGNNNVSQGQFVLKGSDLVLATQRANNNLNIRRGY